MTSFEGTKANMLLVRFPANIAHERRMPNHRRLAANNTCPPCFPIVPHRQGIARPPPGGLRSTTARAAAAPPAFDLMRFRNGEVGQHR